MVRGKKKVVNEESPDLNPTSDNNESSTEEDNGVVL
jgi:hypothetical protein